MFAYLDFHTNIIWEHETKKNVVHLNNREVSIHQNQKAPEEKAFVFK